MNLKSLPPKVRALVEALEEPTTDAGYEIVDVDEDGDTVAITFNRNLGSNDEDREDGDDDD